MEDVERLLFCLRDKKVIEGMEDTIRQTRTKMVCFFVKSMYKELEQITAVGLYKKKPIKKCTRSWNKDSPSLSLRIPFGEIVCSQRCASLCEKQLGKRF